jgi:sterol desaturase/sphingolipid hydroxylase (fatty acid hydroxylase superfamily)
MRNYTLLYFVENGTTHKSNIHNSTHFQMIPIEKYKYEFDMNLIHYTCIETITFMLESQLILLHLNDKNKYSTFDFFAFFISFIPISFCFEFVFDFFHYFAHRLLHHPYLYKYLHKKHHTFKHPIAITTFYQHPIDIVLTNTIPTVLALYVIPVSNIQFHFILVYKTFVEISGHCGKKLYPTSSFCQCIWLPKLLSVALYVEDHDLHHSLNNCNYAKRFSFWDKLFGTYKSTVSLPYVSKKNLSDE